MRSQYFEAAGQGNQAGTARRERATDDGKNVVWKERGADGPPPFVFSQALSKEEVAAALAEQAREELEEKRPHPEDPVFREPEPEPVLAPDPKARPEEPLGALV